jgi:hypothetical protein
MLLNLPNFLQKILYRSKYSRGLNHNLTATASLSLAYAKITASVELRLIAFVICNWKTGMSVIRVVFLGERYKP